MLNYFFNVEEINPQDVHSKMEKGSDIFLLDVREPHEHSEIRIKDSVLIPRGILESNQKNGYEKEFKNLDMAKNKEIIVICRSGTRSLYSTRFLKQNGFTNVKSMKSGVMGWAQNSLPVSGSIWNNSIR